MSSSFHFPITVPIALVLATLIAASAVSFAIYRAFMA
jgi:hypothetical protein